MTKITLRAVGLLALLLIVSEVKAQETRLKWWGHAAFSVTTPKGKVLLIDPWLSNPSNPDVKDKKDPLATVSKVDYILLTHGHRDHVGDAVEIARKTSATLICAICPRKTGNSSSLRYVSRYYAKRQRLRGGCEEIEDRVL